MLSLLKRDVVVYDVKCIVDSLLDLSEELTDGLLNATKELLGLTTLFVCGPGALNVLDICVNVPGLDGLGLGL